MAFAAALSACKAHMIETHGDSKQLFKTGLEKQGKGGVVRYLGNGLPAMKKARRADAEKQMSRFCGEPGYKIAEEGPRSKFGSRMPIPKGGLEMDEYQYVAFECGL